MKRLALVLIFCLASTTTVRAQEATTEPQQNTDSATEATNAAAPEAPAPVALAAPTPESAAAQEEPKISLSKGELEALVQQMVAAELAKRPEAEKAAKEPAAVSPELAKADSQSDVAPEHKAINDTRDDMVGLILPEISKTGITFVMGDDNLRDNSQYSVAWDIGQRPEYEDFFERIYGYSNTTSASTRLSVYHEEVSPFNPHLSARMALNFKMVNKMDNIDDSLSTAIYEDQSYIDLQYKKPGSHLVKLTLYPYNADSIAIGYMRGLRWGSRDAYPQISRSTAVPGFQLLYGYNNIVNAYVALKTHAQEIKDKLNTEFVPKETTVSLFAGVSMKLKNGLSGHLQFAFIDKGENAKIDDSLLGERDKDDQIYSYGVDAFVQYEYGSAIGDPLGINAYTNRQWISPDYTSNMAFRARLEYIFAIQRLMNADYLKDVTPITALYPAHGLGGEVAFRYSNFRLFGLASMRTLSFLTFDSPGVNPFETMASDSTNRPETTLSLHADYKVKMFWFGLGLAYKIPATYTIKDASGQEIVTVVKDRITSDTISYAFDRTREVLPAGQKAKNMWLIKADIKAQITKSVSAGIEYSFTRDPNRAKLVEKVVNGVGTGLFVSDWDNEKVQNAHSLVLTVDGRF